MSIEYVALRQMQTNNNAICSGTRSNKKRVTYFLLEIEIKLRVYKIK